MLREHFPFFHTYRTELTCILNDPESKDIPQTKHKDTKIIKHSETEWGQNIEKIIRILLTKLY